MDSKLHVLNIWSAAADVIKRVIDQSWGLWPSSRINVLRMKFWWYHWKKLEKRRWSTPALSKLLEASYRRVYHTMFPGNPGLLPDFHEMGIFSLTHASIAGPDLCSRGISCFFAISVKSVEVEGDGMAILYEPPSILLLPYFEFQGCTNPTISLSWQFFRFLSKHRE